MNLSRDKPTKPGWYWWRNLSKGNPPALVEVTIDGDTLLKSGPPAYFREGVFTIDDEEWADRDAVMNWTIDKPTVPGWYWYRGTEQEHQVLMGLHGFGDTIKAVWPDGHSEAVIDMPGEWSGPVERPVPQ